MRAARQFVGCLRRGLHHLARLLESPAARRDCPRYRLARLHFRPDHPDLDDDGGDVHRVPMDCRFGSMPVGTTVCLRCVRRPVGWVIPVCSASFATRGRSVDLAIPVRLADDHCAADGCDAHHHFLAAPAGSAVRDRFFRLRDGAAWADPAVVVYGAAGIHHLAADFLPDGLRFA